MPEIVTIATFTLADGKHDEAVRAFEEVTAQTHEEDGCLRYAWVQGLEDPNKIAVVEKWRDLEAVTAHGQSPHLAELRAKLGGLLAEPPAVVRYEELGLGEPERGHV